MGRQSNANIERNRRAKRAAVQKADRSTSGRPDREVVLELARLRARIGGLEKALEKFTEVYNINMNAFSKAFMTTDGHVYVINRLMQDIAKGTAHFSVAYKAHLATHPSEPYESEDVFDLAYYFELFNDMQRRRAEEAQKKLAEEGKDAAQKDEQAEEFGGDYGETQDGNEGETPAGNEQGDSEGDGEGRDEKAQVPEVREPVAPTEGV